MVAEEGRAEEEDLDPAGLCDEHLLLLGEEGETLAQGGVRGFEWAVGLEYLGKEPITQTAPKTHTHTHQEMIQPSREGGAPFIHSETLAWVYIYLQFSKIRSKAKANRFVHSTGYLHACRLVKA